MNKYKYFSEDQTITSAGRWIVERQNRFLMTLIDTHINSASHPSVLEIGPGHGAFAMACRARGFGYEGVEASRSMAERLRNNGFEVTVSVVPPLPEGASTP